MTKFKLNDKVICITNFGVSNWLEQGQEYTVTRIYSNGDIAVNGIKNNLGWYAHRFELKQENQQKILQDKPSYAVEEKDMTQQTQQKTKVVPFTHELWEGWKDKGGKVIYGYGPHIIKDMVCFDNAVTTYRYAGYCEELDMIYVCEGNDLSLEIPVTTKRVPFNPELKDAKAFYGEVELTEWVQMKSGVVCGIIKHEDGGYTTSLYHPNILEMEVEE